MTHQDNYRAGFKGKKSRLGLSLLLAGFCPIAPLSAAVFNVTDEAGLSSAITTSNSNGEDDTINIAAGTITLTAALPQVEEDPGFNLSIIGAGQTSTIVEAGDLPQELSGGTGTHTRRVFYFNDNTSVSMSDMTVRRGRLSEASPYGANIHARGDFSIERCTISEAVGLPTTQGRGGGLYVNFNSNNFDMSDCIVENNLVRGSGFITAGAGMYIQSQNVSIRDTTFDGNIVENDNMGSGSTASGGGAYILGPNQIIDVSGCTFSNNRVLDLSVAQAASARGGGLGTSSNLGGLYRNCTFSNNEATDFGGGLHVGRYSSGVFPDVRFEGCTITNNTAGDSGGGVLSTKGEFRNCIIAGNTAPTETDISNSEFAVLLGYNLIGDGTGTTFTSTESTDMIGTSGSPIDPLLDVLADNGGPTLTHALMAGSPAIDMGTDQAITTATITMDQRGFARVAGSQADIGAYEFGSVGADTTSPTPTIAAIDSPTSLTTITGVAVDFDEDVATLETSDFLTTGITVTAVNGGPQNYTIDISTSGDGVKELQLPSGAVDDLATTPNASLASNVVSFTLDTDGPEFTTRLFSSNNSTNTNYARTGDTITITLEADEPVTTPTVELTGFAIPVTGGPVNWTAVRVLDGTIADGGKFLQISDYRDLAGNYGSNTNTNIDTGGNSLIIDNDPPAIASPLAPTSGQANPTSTQPVVFDISFGPSALFQFDETSIDLSSSTAPGSLTASIGFSKSNNTKGGGDVFYDISVSGATGSGDIIVNLVPANIFDAAGNVLPSAGPSATVQYLDTTDVGDWSILDK